MPLLFILGAFVTGAFVSHGAHAAVREIKDHIDDRHDELKGHVAKLATESK